MKCPNCGKNEFREILRTNYKARVKGAEFVVGEAVLLECGACGETAVSAEEVHRWENLYNQDLISRGIVPTATQVKEIRERLNYSVSDFAKLFSVTRQTVYAWEKADGNVVQMGPAMLLIRLLLDELRGELPGINRKLRAYAKARGQAIGGVEEVGQKTIEDAPVATAASPETRSSGCLRVVPDGARFFRESA